MDFVAICDRLPFFRAAAGKRWFRRYVADPIPEHVCGLSGGYCGGLAKGIILTGFDFSPPFERSHFPNGWKKSSEAVAETVGLLVPRLVERYLGLRIQVTVCYTKAIKPRIAVSAWLLIDELANKGVLYEAAFFPLLQSATTYDPRQSVTTIIV